MPGTRSTLVPEDLDSGIARLSAVDPDFERIVRTAGRPAFPRRPPGFGTLLQIILEQQVSIASAAAIWARLAPLCPGPSPTAFATLTDDQLRACGFSRQKVLYARHLAAAILEGRFDPASLAALDDGAATEVLVSLKGIGQWSAEVYLLFALGRPDIWPAGDLGLQVAAQHLKGLPARPDHNAMRAMGEAWRPWRSVAACLLWQFYLTTIRPPGRL